MEEKTFFTPNSNDIYRSFNYALNNAVKVKKLDIKSQKREVLPPGIEQLMNIEELDLSDNQFRHIPEGVADLPNLNRLDISQTSISSLAPLKGKQSLLFLNCNDTKVTQQELDEFRKHNPNCQLVANVKDVKPLTLAQKAFNLFMIALCMAFIFVAIKFISPTSNAPDKFLIRFGIFIIATSAVASLINYIYKLYGAKINQQHTKKINSLQ